MTDEAAILRAIIENPSGDLYRLVYADFLQEVVGDETRGQFIRLQCEASRIESMLAKPFEDQDLCSPVSASWCPNCGDCCCPDREQSMCYEGCELHRPESRHGGDDSLKNTVEELNRRSKEILWENWRSWCPQIIPPRNHSFRVDDAKVTTLTGDGAYASATFSRGFVSAVRLPVAKFMGDICEECNGEGGSYEYNTDDPGNQLMNVSHWHDCRKCDGDGYLGEACPTCFGKGVVEPVVRYMDHDEFRYEPAIDPCPSCNGGDRGDRLIRKLLSRHPIDRIELMDREACTRTGNVWSFWRWPSGRISGIEPSWRSELPTKIFDRLKNPDGSGRILTNFSTKKAGDEALANACLEYAREVAQWSQNYA